MHLCGLEERPGRWAEYPGETGFRSEPDHSGDIRPTGWKNDKFVKTEIHEPRGRECCMALKTVNIRQHWTPDLSTYVNIGVRFCQHLSTLGGQFGNLHVSLSFVLLRKTQDTFQMLTRKRRKRFLPRVVTIHNHKVWASTARNRPKPTSALRASETAISAFCTSGCRLSRGASPERSQSV